MRILRILAFVLGVLACPLLRAQDINASLSGTVTDPSGAVVPNASVRIINSERNVLSFEGRTNSAGIFTAPSLPAGMYRVEVEATGFSKAVVQDVRLQVDQRARVDLLLKPGEVAEVITVTGEGLGQLETESSSIAAVINTSQVRDLPFRAGTF